MMEVPTNLAAACGFITCYPCPGGVGDCTDFAADSAVWDNTGTGPLTPVP